MAVAPLQRVLVEITAGPNPSLIGARAIRYPRGIPALLRLAPAVRPFAGSAYVRAADYSVADIGPTGFDEFGGAA